MIKRVQTYFPRLGKQVGESQLRVIVRFASSKALTDMLTHERSVALYLDLICLLGGGFDKDPQIPWAAAILADRSFPNQAERIDSLHSRAWEYADKISADFESPPGNKQLSLLAQCLSEVGYESAEDLLPQAAREAADEMIAQLRRLFPIKCEVIGNECLRTLVQGAFASAARYHIRNPRRLFLFSILMFALGSGFDCDPQFPWASKTLTDNSLSDPVMRIDHLYA